MKLRKKFSLAIFFGVSATIMVFYGIKGPELTAYGVIVGLLMAAFGYADVKGKPFEGDR